MPGTGNAGPKRTEYRVLRAEEIGRFKPVSRSDCNSSDSLLATTHPAHIWHEILPVAKSAISRQYRFGLCRRKQQSTRDECGEALLDTERGEMVRSQRGTVA